MSADLERLLTELSTHLDVPPEPDLVAAVRERIRVAPRRRRLGPVVWTRRSIALATALLVLASGIAVASYFGVRGIRIRVGESPTASPSPGATLDLGQRASLRYARSSVPFSVRIPFVLGPPDEVYLSYRILGGQVTLVYRPRQGLPETSVGDVGMLLSQFQGSFSRSSIDKFVRQDQVHAVTVGGEPGFWIEGAHEVGYVDSGGNLTPDTVRLSGSALLWQIGSVTLRLESALPLEGAIRLAETVH
jgi:hypothetical protein